MNVDRARDLLFSFKDEVQHKVESDPTSRILRDSYQTKITELFIDNFCGNDAVPKSSWRGGVSYYLIPNHFHFERRKLIIEKFAEAIKLLRETPSEAYMHEDLFFSELHREFTINNFLPPPTGLEDYSKQKLEVFQKIKNEQRQKERDEYRQFSLLHSEEPVVFDASNLSILRFQKIFQTWIDGASKVKGLFNLFLSAKSEFANCLVVNKTEAIDEALEVDATLKKRLFKDFHPISKSDRKEMLAEESKKISNQLGVLVPGERLILVGSFGTEFSTVETFFRMLKKLPNSIFSKLPDKARAFIYADVVLPDPKELVGKTIQPYLDKLASSLPELDAGSSKAMNVLLNLFLYDERKPSPEIFSLLPPSVQEELQVLIQNGLIGNLVDFTRKGSYEREVLEWVCLNGEIFRDADRRKVFVEDRYERLAQYGYDNIGDPKGIADHTIHQMIDKIQSLIPTETLERTGLKDHIRTGQVWLEFEKAEDETVTIYVYGTGEALKHHPVNEKGQYEWPLKIEGVNQSQLTAECLETILIQHVEPSFDHLVPADLESIYMKLKELKKSDYKDRKEPVWRKVEKDVYRKEQFVNYLKINPEYSISEVLFEFKLQVFVDYCKMNLDSKTGQLVIKDRESYKALTAAIESLQEELAHLKMDRERLNQIRITFKEAHAAIQEWKTSGKDAFLKDYNPENLKLPEEIALPLRTFAFATGITSNFLKEFKSTLIWAFGYKIEPLIDFFIRVLPVSGSAKMYKQEMTAEGSDWSWKQRSSVIKLLTHVYVQAIFSAIKVLLAFVGLFRASVSFLTILSGLNILFEKTVPKHYQRWVYAVTDKIKYGLFHSLLKIILYILLNPSKAHMIQGLLQNHLSEVERLGQKLNGDDLVSYWIFPKKINPYAVRGSSKTDKEVKIDLKDFRHFLDPISQFCPLDQIEAWRKADENIISRFSLKRYGMDFKVDREMRAWSDQWKGYMLSSVQKNPVLDGINSFLIFENEQGDRRVLISDGQWVSAGVWRIMKKAGPFASFAGNYLKGLDQQFMHALNEMLGELQGTIDYFEYDYDPLTNSLTSPVPEAMAYLVMISLLQGKKEAAFRACEEFEKLMANTQCFNEKVLQKLLAMGLMPVNSKENRLIRMRMFAAIAKYRMENVTNESYFQEKDVTIPRGLEMLIGIFSLIDLDYIASNPHQSLLSDAQEFCLYRSVLHSFKQLLHYTDKAQTDLSHEKLLHLTLKPDLLERYYRLSRSIVNKREEVAEKLSAEPISVPIDDKTIEINKQLFKRFIEKLFATEDESDLDEKWEQFVNADSAFASSLSEIPLAIRREILPDLLAFKESYVYCLYQDVDLILKYMNNQKDEDLMTTEWVAYWLNQGDITPILNLCASEEERNEVKSLLTSCATHWYRISHLEALIGNLY